MINLFEKKKITGKKRPQSFMYHEFMTQGRLQHNLMKGCKKRGSVPKIPKSNVEACCGWQHFARLSESTS